MKLQAGDLDAMLINLADRARRRRRQAAALPHGRRRPRQAAELQVAGKETITIGGKPQQATKVARTDGNKQTIAWMGREDMPVPARILQPQGGQDEMDLRLKSVP